MEKRLGQKKQRTGMVTSDKMDKTVSVKLERKFAHPIYKKVIKVHKTVYAHDPEGIAKEGDIIRIMETRPLSKLKRWRVVEVVKSAYEAEETKE